MGHSNPCTIGSRIFVQGGGMGPVQEQRDSGDPIPVNRIINRHK